MSALTTKKPSPICPKCGCNKTHRTMRIGVGEWFLHYFRFLSPYRCEYCDARFIHSRFVRQAKKQLHHHPV